MLSTFLQTHARVAFIGTRAFTALSEPIRTLFAEAAASLAERRALIVTGAEGGADQAAATAALAAGGDVHLVLPWPTYEQAWVRSIRSQYYERVNLEVYDPRLHRAWTGSVRTYHPAPERLTRSMFALHARNFGVVANAAAAIAAAKNSAQGGVTGQGIRIARGLGIPVIDFWGQRTARPSAMPLPRRPDTNQRRRQRVAGRLDICQDGV